MYILVFCSFSCKYVCFIMFNIKLYRILFFHTEVFTTCSARADSPLYDRTTGQMCAERAARTIPGAVLFAFLDTHRVSRGPSWKEHGIRLALPSCCLTNEAWGLKTLTVRERVGPRLHLGGRAYAKKFKLNLETEGWAGPKQSWVCGLNRKLSLWICPGLQAMVSSKTVTLALTAELGALVEKDTNRWDEYLVTAMPAGPLTGASCTKQGASLQHSDLVFPWQELWW